MDLWNVDHTHSQCHNFLLIYDDKASKHCNASFCHCMVTHTDSDSEAQCKRHTHTPVNFVSHLLLWGVKHTLFLNHTHTLSLSRQLTSLIAAWWERVSCWAPRWCGWEGAERWACWGRAVCARVWKCVWAWACVYARACVWRCELEGDGRGA